MAWLYPTFTSEVAAKELSNLENRLRRTDGEIFTAQGVIYRHPKANFPSTGGEPVPASRLEELRDFVIAGIDEIKNSSNLTKSRKNREIDRILSQRLGEWFSQESDKTNSADPNIWSFLALVIFPDVAINRFPPESQSLSAERFLAGRRNIFYRPYLRYIVLGDGIMSDEDIDLYEDELVGLVDRNLSADHRLSQAIAHKIASLDSSSSRREIVRNGFKNIQFELKVTDLTSLTNAQLTDVIRYAFR